MDEAARELDGTVGCSVRQARRYVEVADWSGGWWCRGPGTVFTVKLPDGLAGRVRE